MRPGEWPRQGAARPDAGRPGCQLPRNLSRGRNKRKLPFWFGDERGWGSPSGPTVFSAGRATQLCPEQMGAAQGAGGQEATSAPRKALAAGVARCGVVRRRGVADDRGRGARRGQLSSHANIVSCNHCRVRRRAGGGSAEADPRADPRACAPAPQLRGHPLPSPSEGRSERGPFSGDGGTLPYLLYPRETELLAPAEVPQGPGPPPSSQHADTPPHPSLAARAGRQATGSSRRRAEHSTTQAPSLARPRELPTLNKSKVTTPSRSVSKVLKNPVY